MAKLDNVLAILWMLSSDKKVTAKQISDKLEMNIRTVYRYMDTLSKVVCLSFQILDTMVDIHY